MRYEFITNNILVQLSFLMILFRQAEQTLHSSHIAAIYLGTQQVKASIAAVP